MTKVLVENDKNLLESLLDMVVAWQRMMCPLKNKSKAGVERLRKAKRDNAKKEVKKIKTLAKELAYVISIDSCTRQLLSQIRYMHDYSVRFLLFSVTNHFSSVSPSRTVLLRIRSAHLKILGFPIANAY